VEDLTKLCHIGNQVLWVSEIVLIGGIIFKSGGTVSKRIFISTEANWLKQIKDKLFSRKWKYPDGSNSIETIFKSSLKALNNPLVGLDAYRNLVSTS
jgi:hypothetical protein